jgi:hypothetical protein
MKSLFAVLLLSASLISSHDVHQLCRGILPENDWKIPVGVKTGGGITEQDFNDVLDMVEKAYAPVFGEKGAKFEIDRQWENSTVNAYASQSGDTWMIAMFGGLARHQAITRDGFALVACHEIGHHIGGAPKYNYMDWASTEGQSDYFGTLKCMRYVFGADDNEKIVSNMDVHPHVEMSCRARYGQSKDQALCIRLAYAGLSLAQLFADFEGLSTPLSFEIPDSHQVSETVDDHPAAQCRLDTYYSGSLCPVTFNEEVSENNPAPGTCFGTSFPERTERPRCWFAP